MTEQRSRWLFYLAGLLVVVGLPLAGKWARRRQSPHCEFDGLNIEPRYLVRVVDRAGQSHSFCCVRCARQWLKRQPDPPRAVYVTDEVSGAEIDSRSACFVVSEVTTNPITGNHTHVFRNRRAAEAHARAFEGAVLAAEEQPFRTEHGDVTGAASPGR
jgi:hypothetical protein